MRIGIGLIEKCLKNRIKWKGTLNIPNDMQLDYELIQARKQQKSLQEEISDLTQYGEKLQEAFSKMSSDPSYGELTWLTYDDISRLGACDENRQSKLIVIKAPPGTQMEIPDPKEVAAYFAELKKKAGTASSNAEAERLLRNEKDIEDKQYQINMCSKTDEIMVYTVENEDSDLPPPAPENNEHSEAREAESLSNMFGR